MSARGRQGEAMTSSASVLQSSAPRSAAATAVPGRMLLRDLERPQQVLSNITPNWYASVMGRGGPCGG